MSFSIGIVGLPNVGKSTLFKALTKKPIEIANYPFCTIDPNVGVVTVPDKRLDQLAKVSHSEKIIPTAIEFFDIAGLVKNAHQGEGLGNQFLSHIRETKAIVQVLRGFEDTNVTHVHNKIDPDSDKETINLELIMADLKTIEKRLHEDTKKARGMDKDAMKQTAVYGKIKSHLEQEKLVSQIDLNDDEAEIIKPLNLLTAKPMLYVLNVDEHDIDKSHPDYITISAKIEAELADLSKDEAKKYLAELNLTQSGLDKLITESYQLLDLITFFSTAPNETRAWTVKKGTKAPQAAGEIHTDFKTGFIKADVIDWKSFVKCGGEQAARDKGLMRTEGKEYVMKDGDVALFKFKV